MGFSTGKKREQSKSTVPHLDKWDKQLATGWHLWTCVFVFAFALRWPMAIGHQPCRRQQNTTSILWKSNVVLYDTYAPRFCDCLTKTTKCSGADGDDDDDGGGDDGDDSDWWW